MTDNGEYLLLEIEDDGKGYPDEILRQFENGEPFSADTGSRVGLWSLRRMMELMYEDGELFQIANIAGGGCINRFRIPRQAVQEIKFENISGKFE